MGWVQRLSKATEVYFSMTMVENLLVTYVIKASRVGRLMTWRNPWCDLPAETVGYSVTVEDIVQKHLIASY